MGSALVIARCRVAVYPWHGRAEGGAVDRWNTGAATPRGTWR